MANAVPVPLLGGAYQSRAVQAGFQRCVNLYPENTNQQKSQASVPVAHFLTPGLLSTAAAPIARPYRALGLYRATNDEVFSVIGGNVYYLDATFTYHLLGNIPDAVTPVGMFDNGSVLVIVDGTAIGYAVDLATHAMAAIGAGFQTASAVTCIDTFFVMNVVGTNQFYLSISNVSYAQLSGGTGFDPLDVAAKTSSPDTIQTLISINGELWLIGTITSEIWGNTGNAEFPFERISGAVANHGAAAKYSIAFTDTSAYFLMQDRQGFGIIVQTAGYALKRVSTFPIEEAIQGYSSIADAFGYVRQQDGHAFYVITFPTANHTWALELESQDWHEWVSIDNNGNENRHRSNCFTSAYGRNLIGDYADGTLYELDTDTYLDGAMPIIRIRSWPFLTSSMARVTAQTFIAFMQTGYSVLPNDTPMISLRWSTDGKRWTNREERSLGLTGQYEVVPRWDRLGMGRGRVFELSWSANAKTVLNGAFVQAGESAT